MRFARGAIDPYTETGLLAAHIRTRDTTSAQTGLGAEIAVDLPTGLGTLTPHLRTTWRHELGDTRDALSANFLAATSAPVPTLDPTPPARAFPVAASPVLSVNGARQGRDFLALTVGMGGQVSGVTLSADYSGQIGGNRTIHQVSLTARLVF